MSDVKFLMMCPRPQNIETFEHLDQDDEVTAGEGLSSEYAATFEAFEKLYQEEHVPTLSRVRAPSALDGYAETGINRDGTALA